MTKVQNDSGFSLARANPALKDGVDIAVGPCTVRVPAQAVADAHAAWSALRAEAGEDAAQRIYEAMSATLDKRIEAAARDLEMDRRSNKKTMVTAWSMTSCGGTSSFTKKAAGGFQAAWLETSPTRRKRTPRANG